MNREELTANTAGQQSHPGSVPPSCGQDAPRGGERWRAWQFHSPVSAGRLFRLLTLLGNGPLTRQQILRKLRIDVRGFYRDLEALRALGVEVEAGDDNRYALVLDFDEAWRACHSPTQV